MWIHDMFGADKPIIALLHLDASYRNRECLNFDLINGCLYPDTVAVSVHMDIGKFVLVTEFLHDVHHQVLLAAVAGSLNHFSCEGQKFLCPFLI